MPPAVVCALAIVSTIGAVFVFKQFVYDPHLSHVVRRWTEELKQWRRHPADIQHRDDDHPDVPLDERAKSSGMRSDETPVPSYRRGTRPADGLLSRSRLRPIPQEEKSSIELDNLIARALGERNHGRATLSNQDLRQRTAANRVSRQDAHDDWGHHPLELEEDANPLPKYVPLSPRRTHVVCNSGSASPATPAFDSDLNGLPSESTPLTTTSSALHMLPSSSSPRTAIVPPLIGSPSLSGSTIWSQDPLLQNQLGETQVSPNMDRGLDTLASSPSKISARFHAVLLPPSTASLSHSPISSPARSQEQEQNSPSPFLLRVPSVPSLSQSYPQELEVEHGLELLSAPSSRPDSPYSMANISPHPSAMAHKNLDGVLRHPFGSPPSDVFSPALEVGFGNESFATLSPAVGPKQLALRAAGGSGLGMYPVSPVASGSFEATAQDHPSDISTPLSVTNSSESNTYHSFSELESGSEDDDDVPLSARRASLILSMSADSNSPRKTVAREDPGHGQGLGLTFGPPSPENLPAPLTPSILSPRSLLAEVSTNVDGAHSRPPIGPPSDTSELSDLDFMSDYSASSELGEVVSYPGSVNGSKDLELGGGSHPQPTNGSSDRESDASWSIAGGSDFGDDAPQPPTPQLRPMRELKRDDTIRLRKKL